MKIGLVSFCQNFSGADGIALCAGKRHGPINTYAATLQRFPTMVQELPQHNDGLPAAPQPFGLVRTHASK